MSNPPATDPDHPKSPDQYLSVLADPVNFNVKHPLSHAWSLWYDGGNKKTSQSNWSQNLKKLVDFDTVEDFWGVYNNIAKATELVSGSNYHLFKLGVRPMWEDKMNEKGGKWVLQFPRNAKKPEDVNEAWLYTMLACIGAAYEQDEEICGCVMSVRKGFYRIALWIRNGAVDEVVQSCGKQFKASIGFAGNYEWSVHSDAIKPDAGGARRRH